MLRTAVMALQIRHLQHLDQYFIFPFRFNGLHRESRLRWYQDKRQHHSRHPGRTTPLEQRRWNYLEASRSAPRRSRLRPPQRQQAAAFHSGAAATAHSISRQIRMSEESLFGLLAKPEAALLSLEAEKTPPVETRPSAS